MSETTDGQIPRHINREAQLYDEAAGLLTRLRAQRGPTFPGENDRLDRLIEKAERRHDRRWDALVATPEWASLSRLSAKSTLFTEDRK